VIDDKYYIDYVLGKYDNISNVFLKKNWNIQLFEIL
jgi:hypothetical protein